MQWLTRKSSPLEELLVSMTILLAHSWSGCANESLRSYVSGETLSSSSEKLKTSCEELKTISCTHYTMVDATVEEHRQSEMVSTKRGATSILARRVPYQRMPPILFLKT